VYFCDKSGDAMFRVFSAIQEYNLKLLVDIHYHGFFGIDGKFSLVRMKPASHSVNCIQADI
jgi:hypothetical protein